MRTIMIFVLLAGVGCSGGGGAKATPGPTPAQIAADIGCGAYLDDPTKELFVKAAGRCTLGEDASVRIRVFFDNNGRDGFVRASKAFGGSYLVADRAAVEGDPDTLTALQGQHGFHQP